MKLRIRHRTRYRYHRPVALQPHRLLLVPRGGHDLAVVSRTLAITPDATVDWGQDVFGNLIATASFAEPTTALEIVSEAVVDQTAAQWPVFRIDTGAHVFPFAYAEADRIDLGAMMQPTHPDPYGALARWAQGFVAGPTTDTLSLLKDINAGLRAALIYRVRDEEGTQAPLETLSLGSGSCRDWAALFIDAVRHLGFGARAVSGYLHDPDALPDTPGATHAWADVYLPGAGWIAFDPTRSAVGSADLVPVAVARTNQQIMPVTGGYLGTPDDFAGMDVDVSVVARDAAGGGAPAQS